MPLNELRVFISSTFRDLQEEREHLVKKIFPEIRAMCRTRGISFTEVDLRWGLTDEHVLLGQVIRACLEEVDKCRPYFIGITGDRYGYIPSYIDIQKDPSLVAQYPWIEDASIDGMSITEMESEYGVLSPEKSNGQARKGQFYFRRRRATLDDDDVLDEDQAKLKKYKERIRQGDTSVKEFRDAVSLGELVYDDLVEIIKNDFADAEPLTPLQEERIRHDAFSQSRRRSYIANPVYLKRLNEHVLSDEPPLIVYSESGSGKSSLFSFWAEQFRRKNPDVPVIEHYIGIGATSTDHFAVIRHICMEIKELFSRDEKVPTDPNELDTAFGQWLGYADHALKQKNEKLVIILDGLNQLKGAGSSLKWLPEVVVPSIRMIISSTIEGTLLELKDRGWAKFGIQALSIVEREAVVIRYLADFRKSLSPDQIKLISSDHKCGHPLFLKTLLEELRLVSRHEDVQHRIDEYLDATGAEDLFQMVLERIEEDHGARSVRSVLSSIWCSRYGLDERELSEITGVSRLKVTSMTTGLDYHLVPKEGRLTFFHDYLQRAVEKRYLREDSIRQKTHKQLADYFIQVSPNERIANEAIWQTSQLGEDQQLADVLGNLQIIQLAFSGAARQDVLSNWARLRAAGIDPVTTYKASFNALEESVEFPERLEAMSAVGKLLELLGEHKGAIEIHFEEIEIAESSGNDEAKANAEQSLGRILSLKGELVEAMVRLNSAYDTFERLENKSGMALAVGAIGHVHDARMEYDLALKCFEKWMAISEDLDDTLGAARAAGNIGGVHFNKGENELAVEWIERSASLVEQIGDNSGHAILVGNLGMIHAALGRYELAIDHFERATKVHRSVGFRRGLTYWLDGTAKCMIELVESDEKDKGGAETGSIPEYLSRFLSEVDVEQWHTSALGRARTLLDEVVSISDELSFPEMGISGRILLARVDALEENLSSAEKALVSILDSYEAQGERGQNQDRLWEAECHFWLWTHKLDADVDHFQKSLTIFEELYAIAPRIESEKRLLVLREAMEN